jgi:F-type H+/Na+-transporting ATPase subunit alpha
MATYTKNIILTVSDNILIAGGLEDGFINEVVSIVDYSGKSSGSLGVILSLEYGFARIALIKKVSLIQSGLYLQRTFEYIQTHAGYGVLGTVITPLGDVVNIDDYTKSDLLNIHTHTSIININTSSASIIERESICTPLLTGIAAVDSLLPIGCGQRELIIGDSNTGKTTLALTIILNQKNVLFTVGFIWRFLETDLEERFMIRFTPCIYVFIGKRRSELIRSKNVLISRGSFDYTCIVFTSSDDLAAIQYFSAYAGSSIAEWFKNKGYNAIIVYDDLSEHAVAYRQMALLLRRPPGREAYPGDIFYIHSKLLERSSFWARGLGGSVTAFPIIETKSGDIASYIPTNVISITDGQIFLSKTLFNKGIKPCVDLGFSVSRIGSNAQYTCMKFVSKKLRRDYLLYKSYEGIAKVSTELSPAIARAISRGKIILAYFTQNRFHTYHLYELVISLYLITGGYLDNVNPKYVRIYFEVLFKGQMSDLFLYKDHLLYNLLSSKEIATVESMLKIIDMQIFGQEIKRLGSLYSKFFETEVLHLIKSNPEFKTLIALRTELKETADKKVDHFKKRFKI